MMEIKGSRIVVTGGAGFIGSHLADCLIEAGCDVLVIDDFSTGDDVRLSRHKNSPALEIVHADVRNEDRMARLLAGADFVFHLAARGVRFSLTRPAETHDVNASGTLNMLRAAAAAGVRRFLYCSSSEAVGPSGGGGAASGAGDFNPATIYGASKLAGEFYSTVFNGEGGMETVIARPHNNYGPRSHYLGYRGELIPRFIVRALAGEPLTIFGDGSQTRDFTYVTETASLLVEIMKKGTPGEIIEICTGIETPVSAIAENIVELTGSQSPIRNLPARPGDVASMKGDTTRLLEVTGAAPQIGMRDGLEKTVEWFKKNVAVNAGTLAAISDRNWEDVEPETPPGAAASALDSGPKIPLARPLAGEREARAARRAILSGWVAQGPRVREFEQAFAEFTGARHACAVSSGTAALHLALLAAGVRPGDTVITVSHSFISTANAVRHCGAEPVFVDIGPATLNMDPAALETCLKNNYTKKSGELFFNETQRIAIAESPLAKLAEPTGRLAAIIAVHQVGIPADMARLTAIAASVGVPLIEDAACAAGSEIFLCEQWQKIGRPHGDIACFSFHPRKTITTGEGGMLTTNNPDYDAAARQLRHQGMSVSDLDRHSAATAVQESYPVTGFNYRMSDIQAAVGIEQLRRLPCIVARRRELAAVYENVIAELAPHGVHILKEPEFARTNYQSLMARPDDPAMQAKIIDFARGRGIAMKPGIMNAHMEKPYSAAWPAGCLPASESARSSFITLPLYHDMSEKDIRTVVAALRDCNNCS